MVDENGTKFCGIKYVFRLDFLVPKVVNCQMHFKNDIIKALAKLGSSFKEELKNMQYNVYSGNGCHLQ